MKVAISFNETTVMVPVGEGNITVRELSKLAVVRYERTIKDPGSFRVCISSLKWEGNGGVLNPDDKVSEVCDEREHLIAVFEWEATAGNGHSGPQDDEMSFSSNGVSDEETWASSDSASAKETAAAAGLTGAACLNTTGATKKVPVQV